MPSRRAYSRLFLDMSTFSCVFFKQKPHKIATIQDLLVLSNAEEAKMNVNSTINYYFISI